MNRVIGLTTGLDALAHGLSCCWAHHSLGESNCRSHDSYGKVCLRSRCQLVTAGTQAIPGSLISEAAQSVEGVLAIEKLRVRKAGFSYLVDLHVQVESTLSIQTVHIIGGKVKSAIRHQVPAVDEVLVHIEPFEVQLVPEN